MNIAYSEEMRPPKELFSRDWFESSTWYKELFSKAWDTAGHGVVHCRIDKTKKKLEDLETKLLTKFRKSGGYTRYHLLETITILKSCIGVWETTKSFLVYDLPHRNVTMVYPHDASRVVLIEVGGDWDKVVLGGVQREGVCLAMLSPQCVEWLNEISYWVGE